MQDVVFKWAVQVLLRAVAQFLTPDKVEEGKVLLIAFLRKEAKELSPGSLIDDQLVEIFARALNVPIKG